MGDDVSKDLLDELAADFMERRRRGESPKLSEYTQQYPELAEDAAEIEDPADHEDCEHEDEGC